MQQDELKITCKNSVKYCVALKLDTPMFFFSFTNMPQGEKTKWIRMGGLRYVAAIYLVCHHSCAVNDNDSGWRLGSPSLIVQDVKDSNGLYDRNYLHLKRKKENRRGLSISPRAMVLLAWSRCCHGPISQAKADCCSSQMRPTQHR